MKVTVHGKHGRFTLYDNDRWLGRSIIDTGTYSEQEVELLTSLIRDGDTVVEVGSNFGAITVPLAKAVGRRRQGPRFRTAAADQGLAGREHRPEPV